MSERSFLFRLVGFTPGGKRYEVLARARTSFLASLVGRDFWAEQGITATEIEAFFLQEPTTDGTLDGPLADAGIVYELATEGRVFFYPTNGSPRRTRKKSRKQLKGKTMNEISLNNFIEEVLRSPIPVLVDFFSERCGPCRQMAPIVYELGQELEGKAKVAAVDVGEEPELAEQFRITAIPTFLVFRDGLEVGRLRGVQPKQALIDALGLEDRP